jgi:hypothetical protein
VFDAPPVPHPEDRPDETDESGPWLPILAAAVVGWALLVALDYRLLTEGTFAWATVRSAYTLLLAPLAAAALVQDTRALGVAGVTIGRVRWVYAGVALLFPPVSVVYLVHRRVRRRGAGRPGRGPPG